MPILHAILLGIIQGLTEFLPVSSTAHLLVFGEPLGQSSDDGRFRAFTTIIQMGTIVAVILFFRADLARLLAAGLRSLSNRAPFETPDSRLAWLIVLGTIPAAVCGLLFEKRIEDLSNWFIVGGLSILGLVLLGAELFAKHTHTVAEMPVVDALLIGFSQAVALIPGCSRSGSTITAGLLLGLKREDAARSSFLLSVPIMVGAGTYKIAKTIVKMRHPDDPIWKHGPWTASWTTATVLSTVVAGLVGYVVIGWFLAWLRSRTTLAFVAWRLVAAAAIAFMIVKGVLPSSEDAPRPERPVAPAPATESAK